MVVSHRRLEQIVLKKKVTKIRSIAHFHFNMHVDTHLQISDT